MQQSKVGLAVLVPLAVMPAKPLKQIRPHDLCGMAFSALIRGDPSSRPNLPSISLSYITVWHSFTLFLSSGSILQCYFTHFVSLKLSFVLGYSEAAESCPGKVLIAQAFLEVIAKLPSPHSGLPRLLLVFLSCT